MCDISGFDGERCELWNETVVKKSRKQRKCGCCCRTIAVGEMYISHFSKFEGDVCKSALCFECMNDRNEFSKAHDGYIPHPDSFDHTLRECIAEGDEESEKQWQPMLDKILVRMKQKQ
jgi:hypothetical protein